MQPKSSIKKELDALNNKLAQLVNDFEKNLGSETLKKAFVSAYKGDKAPLAALKDYKNGKYKDYVPYIDEIVKYLKSHSEIINTFNVETKKLPTLYHESSENEAKEMEIMKDEELTKKRAKSIWRCKKRITRLRSYNY